MLLKDVKNVNDDKQTNYDAIRYSRIIYLSGLVHAIFTILFFSMHAFPLAIYNLFTVIFYFSTANLLISKPNWYVKLFVLYLIEVIFQAGFATISLGWNYGFMFYTVAFIPISFYITFSIATFKRKMVYPITTTIIIFVSFIAVRLCTYSISPIYSNVNRKYEMILYILNTVIAFMATFLFSALFAIEVNSMQMKLENENQNLETQASYDPLTKFLNRRSMDEQLNRAHRNALINGVEYGLIMCDIDDFKHVNDTYGHDCGDYVLTNIAKLIAAQIRTKDAACRWGGEEFLILINGDKNTTEEVAHRIRAGVEKYEFYYDGNNINITITLGVSSYYPNSKIKTLIEIADKRLYKGKGNGKNQVVVS